MLCNAGMARFLFASNRPLGLNYLEAPSKGSDSWSSELAQREDGDEAEFREELLNEAPNGDEEDAVEAFSLDPDSWSQ